MNVKIKILVNISLLIALEIILSRFCSIATPVMKIGFGFVPIAICAIMYGPLWAGLAGGLADIIGASLFPIGAYFPGFTVSAALTGVVFGVFLFKKSGTFARLGGAVLINCFCVSLLLSTFWLTIITGAPFVGLLPARIVQAAIMAPVQFTVLRLLQKPVYAYITRFA